MYVYAGKDFSKMCIVLSFQLQLSTSSIKVRTLKTKFQNTAGVLQGFENICAKLLVVKLLILFHCVRCKFRKNPKSEVTNEVRNNNITNK